MPSIQYAALFVWLAEEVVFILGVQGIEFVLGFHTAGEGLTFRPELHVTQAGRNTFVPVDVEGIEVDAGADIAAGVNSKRVSNSPYAIRISTLLLCTIL